MKREERPTQSKKGERIEKKGNDRALSRRISDNNNNSPWSLTAHAGVAASIHCRETLKCNNPSQVLCIVPVPGWILGLCTRSGLSFWYEAADQAPRTFSLSCR